MTFKAIWFTNRDGIIGIVKNPNGGYKIGTPVMFTAPGCHDWSTWDEKAVYILDHGAAFPQDAGDALFSKEASEERFDALVRIGEERN